MTDDQYCDCSEFGPCSKYCGCPCHKQKQKKNGEGIVVQVRQPEDFKDMKKKVVLGYGAGAIADYPWHLDRSKPWSEEDETRALKTLQATQECECWTIDTANRYGNGLSERTVGAYLSMLPGVIAQKYFVITKINLGTAVEMYEALQTSISRLGRKPQALLIHNPDFGRKSDVEAACEWLSQDVTAMGIKFVGISTEPTRQVEYYYKNYRSLNVIQYPFSAVDTRAHVEIFPWIEKYQWILKIANRVLGGPSSNSVPDVQGCIDYVVAHKSYVDVVLIGTTNPKHLIQAGNAMGYANELFKNGGKH